MKGLEWFVAISVHWWPHPQPSLIIKLHKLSQQWKNTTFIHTNQHSSLSSPRCLHMVKVCFSLSSNISFISTPLQKRPCVFIHAGTSLHWPLTAVKTGQTWQLKAEIMKTNSTGSQNVCEFLQISHAMRVQDKRRSEDVKGSAVGAQPGEPERRRGSLITPWENKVLLSKHPWRQWANLIPRRGNTMQGQHRRSTSSNEDLSPCRFKIWSLFHTACSRWDTWTFYVWHERYSRRSQNYRV